MATNWRSLRTPKTKHQNTSTQPYMNKRSEVETNHKVIDEYSTKKRALTRRCCLVCGHCSELVILGHNPNSAVNQLRTVILVLKSVLVFQVIFYDTMNMLNFLSSQIDLQQISILLIKQIICIQCLYFECFGV